MVAVRVTVTMQGVVHTARAQHDATPAILLGALAARGRLITQMLSLFCLLYYTW